MPVSLIWLLIASGVLLVAALIYNAIFSFNGTWERMDNASNIAMRERIKLVQLGCFVMGTRVVVGGQQNFFGVALGTHLWMRRRDFGRAFLVNEGFPKEVARQVEGQIMARYRLKLSSDRNFLEGVFIPFRVEFSLEPARVTAMLEQAPVTRKYHRIESILEKGIATAASPAD